MQRLLASADDDRTRTAIKTAIIFIIGKYPASLDPASHHDVMSTLGLFWEPAGNEFSDGLGLRDFVFFGIAFKPQQHLWRKSHREHGMLS